MLPTALRSARPRHAAAIAAAVALSLTAACDDAPVAPSAADAPSAAVAKPAPTPSADGSVPSSFFIRTSTDTAKVFGTSVRFTTDKGSVTVVDNEALDLASLVGQYLVKLPGGSTFYKAEILTVPIGFYLPTAPIMGSLSYNGGGWVSFKEYHLTAKKTLVVNLLNERKDRVPGGKVVVTAPGWDLTYTITDGGEGDLTRMGKQAPADGVITVYMPVSTIATWQVCEVAPPSGYVLTGPECQTVQNGAGPTLKVTILHQGGIVAPPPAM